MLGAKLHLSSVLIASTACVALCASLAIANPAFRHWFVAPLLFCGILTGQHGVAWIRGELDLLDPAGLFGIVAFHSLFTAPLLHIQWNYWPEYVVGPPDWRDWLGAMAILNGLGLLACLWTSSRASRPRSVRTPVYRLHRIRFDIALACALILSASVQTLVLAEYGGLSGYVDAVSRARDSFKNMGSIFIIAESLPIVAVIGYGIYGRGKTWSSSVGSIVLVLALCFAVKLLFGGLRGSRSMTVWTLFWSAGIIHLMIRRIPRILILLGVVFLVTFMYFYGFYKGAGTDALEAFAGSEARARLAEETGRPIEATLLGDLARADIQTYLLYRIVEFPREYDYRWGWTYVADVASLIPAPVWPNRPYGKVQAGTDVQYGRRSFDPRAWVASNVYGLSGEALLNFGPAAVPFAFAVFGIVLGRVRRFSRGLDPEDVRRVLVPFLALLCVVFFIGDLDNTIYFAIQYGSVPVCLVWVSIRRDRAPATLLTDHPIAAGPDLPVTT